MNERDKTAEVVKFTAAQAAVVKAFAAAEAASVESFGDMAPPVAYASALAYLKVPFLPVREARKSVCPKAKAALRLYQKLSTRKSRAASARDPLVSLLSQFARADGKALIKTLANHELRASIVAQCRLMIK